VPGLVGLGGSELPARSRGARLGEQTLGPFDALGHLRAVLGLTKQDVDAEDVLLHLRPVAHGLGVEPEVVLLRIDASPPHEHALDGVAEGEGPVAAAPVGVVHHELVLTPVLHGLLAEGVEERGAEPLRMVLQAVNVALEDGLDTN
jgi:hypothetical protein